jgi:hypothetical protein
VIEKSAQSKSVASPCTSGCTFSRLQKKFSFPREIVLTGGAAVKQKRKKQPEKPVELTMDMRPVRAKEMLAHIQAELDAGNWRKAYCVLELLRWVIKPLAYSDAKIVCGPDYGTPWHIETVLPNMMHD